MEELASEAILPDDSIQEDEDEEQIINNNGDVSDEDAIEEEDVPKLFKHCLELYKLLDERGKGDEGDKIYLGSISPLVVSLGLSPSYQSKLVSRLKEMGSIEMLKRGSGATKSVWGLYKEPTLQDFYASDNTGDIKWRKDKERYDEHTQRIKDITRRVTALEDFAREQGMII